MPGGGRFPPPALWCLCWLALVPTIRLTAQQPAGAIAGEVRDSTSGAGIEGARVLIETVGRVVVTSRSGGFLMGDLAPGSYRLRVAALGYAPITLADVTVSPGDTTRLRVLLSQSSIELPGIVVTASRAPERVEESPASVEVLGHEQVMQRNVTTLDEALPFVPGTTFNGSGQMDIRGSTGSAGGVGSRVLTLIDGHPALSGDGGEIIFESLPLLDLDQAEVVKGAASALYGTNALGGVVNLVTSPIGESPATLVRVHGGAYQIPEEYHFTEEDLTFAGVTVQHSRRLGPLGARLAVGRETSDGFKQNGQYSRWFVRAKASSLPAARHPWDAYAIWSRNVSGDFLAWSSENAPFEVVPRALGDSSIYQMLLAGATVAPIVTSTTTLRISPYLNRNTNQNYFSDNQDYHDATRAGATATLSLLSGRRHQIILGADGAGTRVSSNFLGTPFITDAATFAQDAIALSDQVTLTAGARFDYHDTNEGSAEAALNPKLALVWRRSDRLSLRASLARGYRAPSAIEQFVTATQSGFHVVPNPDLRGEHAWSGELGVAAQPSGRLRIDATLFQNEYWDLIGPAAAPGQFFVFQFQNVSRARVRGLDFAARTILVPDVLDLTASYMFLDSHDLYTEKALPYRSRHNVSGTLELLRGLADVDVRWRSRVEEVLAFPLDPRDDITLVDLRLAYRWLGTVVQAKIGNLLQQVYPDVQERVPGAPRSFSLSVYRPF